MMKKKIYLSIFFILSILLITNILAEDNIITIETHLVNVTEHGKEVNSPQKMQAASTNVDSSIEQIASDYIKERVQDSYFNKHFSFDSFDDRGNIVYAKYIFKYDNEKIDMRVAYDPQNKKVIPQMSSFLKNQSEITFFKDEANEKANNLNLPEPRNVDLVYSSKSDVLAWRVLWNHEPTDEERANNIIEGYSFDITNGDIIQTYQFHYELTNNSSFELVKEKSALAKIWDFVLKIFRGY